MQHHCSLEPAFALVGGSTIRSAPGCAVQREQQAPGEHRLSRPRGHRARPRLRPGRHQPGRTQPVRTLGLTGFVPVAKGTRSLRLSGREGEGPGHGVCGLRARPVRNSWLARRQEVPFAWRRLARSLAAMSRRVVVIRRRPAWAPLCPAMIRRQSPPRASAASRSSSQHHGSWGTVDVSAGSHWRSGSLLVDRDREARQQAGVCCSWGRWAIARVPLAERAEGIGQQTGHRATLALGDRHFMFAIRTYASYLYIMTVSAPAHGGVGSSGTPPRSARRLTRRWRDEPHHSRRFGS